MRTVKCGLCGKHGKTHRKANNGGRKKGVSALKVPKPRSARVRASDLVDHE